MNEREAYIALNMMEQVGPVGVRSLVAHLGSAEAVFRADRAALVGAQGVGPGVAQAILGGRSSVRWEEELERAEALGVRLVAQVDEEYPELLRSIHDPPLALYVLGSLQKRDTNSVAIVGTRRPSRYGADTAQSLAAQLAKAGLVIVSGLALGIDAAAHRGALAARGRTVAVIGSGLDRVYPPSNLELAQRIAEQGAVLSEFPFGRPPDKTTFPVRNRVVSGLSRGVIVVEAGRKSGALITANQALEQGRTVFGVPGRIDSFASQGVHELIRSGAQLITGAGDVLEEFGQLLPSTAGGQAFQPVGGPALTEQERAVVDLLRDGEMDVDSLIRASGLGSAAMSSVLLALEMKRAVRMLPGRMVEGVTR